MSKTDVIEHKTTESAITTPQHLLEMAVQQNADVDKLEKLMALQERWEAAEAKKAYVAALNAFKANPPTLVKNRHVSFGKTSYDHATLDSIAETLGKSLSEHGLSFTWSTSQNEGLITVTCTLTHILGHSESTSLSASPDQSGGKNSIQAVGSTVTYLQRYTLRAITGTAEAGMDTDAMVPKERITEDQALDIESKIKDNGLDMTKFLAWLNRSMKAESIRDIPKVAYQDVVRQIEASIKHKESAK